MLTRLFAIGFMLWTLLFAPPTQAAELLQSGRGRFDLMTNNDLLIKMNLISFGKNWKWMGAGKTTVSTRGQESLFTMRQSNGNVIWKFAISSTDQQLKIDLAVTAKKAMELTYLGFAINASNRFKGGKLQIYNQDGLVAERKFPFGRAGYDNITGFTFVTASGKEYPIKIAKPLTLHIDNDVRLKIKPDHINANEKITNQITLDLGEPTVMYTDLSKVPQQVDTSNWFVFNPKNNTKPGAIGMANWLSKPTGMLAMQDDKVVTPDGKALKIWGTNVEYSATAPQPNVARKRASWFAKYGINAVRLHKLTNPGWEGLGSKKSAAIYDQAALGRFDYFLNELRNRGIYYGFSPIWDLRVFEGDRSKLVAYDEIVKANSRKPVTNSLVWFAKDVQDLHIQTMLNLINHVNPHTKIPYAQDPALAYIEIQNEDDVFFYTTTRNIQKCKTYSIMLANQFSDWLKDKYKTHDGLVSAWGAAAINTFRNEGGMPNEHLNKRNIFPVGNPWFWDNQSLDARRGKRLQDTVLFLLACQNNYYQRMTDAIRNAGYTGPIVTSNWQAGSKTAHFLNLASDAKFGMIDRHNYMGGDQGRPAHVMASGHKLENVTGLADPGSGLLSTGMQQVINRPFVFSEWLAIPPVECAAADTTIIATYGMGLQGWDMSYFFASNGNGFSPTLQFPGNKKFNNLTPVGLGLNPVLSRMVLRQDVQQGDIIAARNITLDQAVTQTYDFKNTTTQAHDLKSFTGSPSHNALAIGRVVIDIKDHPTPSVIKNLSAYQQNNTTTSTTGQLNWTTPGSSPVNKSLSGFFTINTKGTQGTVGFTPNTVQKFDDMTLKPSSPYAVILATAKSPTGTLATDKQAIIVAIARAYNTDMNLGKGMVINVGRAPIILEPVKAEITFKKQSGIVHVLDHDGMRTGKTHRLINGQFKLDTQRDKTIYYLVEFD